MNYKLLQYVFPLGMILFPSCSVALNMIAHSQAKNPKVMTEQQCLDYAEENLRAGIKDIYISSLVNLTIAHENLQCLITLL